ncbi:hypothetical protein CPB84DRAFT_1753413 [Gymnopilus junonius]|uniref:Uncharacterized protein n=1 Tax=Gymnopilus junonius TaxID=109634 RepID=A0A9P5N8Z0_GYMJU|nr:hypothetical protein CPB84DRAFT_1753413 [Gymnopilus junonius]
MVIGNVLPQLSNTPPVGDAVVQPILAPTPSHPKQITDDAPSSSPSQNESSAKLSSISPSNSAEVLSRECSSGSARLSSRKHSSGRQDNTPSMPPSDDKSSESSDNSNVKSTPIIPSNGAKVSSRECFSRNSTKGPLLSSLELFKPALAFSKQPPRTGAMRKKTTRSAELQAQLVGLASKKREVIDLTMDLEKGNFKVLINIVDLAHKHLFGMAEQLVPNMYNLGNVEGITHTLHILNEQALDLKIHLLTLSQWDLLELPDYLRCYNAALPKNRTARVLAFTDGCPDTQGNPGYWNNLTSRNLLFNFLFGPGSAKIPIDQGFRFQNSLLFNMVALMNMVIYSAIREFTPGKGKGRGNSCEDLRSLQNVLGFPFPWEEG